MNRQMIVFGEDWGKHPSSTQHLMKQLLDQYELIWVNSIGLRRPRLCWRDLHRAGEKLKQMIRPVNQDHLSMGGPQVVAPRTLPLPGSDWVRPLNRYLLQRTLQPLLQRSKQQGKQQRPLLWTSLPSAVDMVGKLGEGATVYYCGDDFSSLEGVDHDPILAMEAELAEKADLILTASSQLQARFPAQKTVLLNHGVDYDLFSTPAPRADDFPCHPGPVVGFYGSLAGWLDQSLIVSAARALSGWQFVFIGQPQVDTSALAREPNIRLLGPRPHAELPGYIQHWDISILPFCQNAQIDACNPLKLREYMAAGTPIVSTQFPALQGYSDLIRVGRDSRSFINALRCARTESERCRQRRQQRVAGESWQTRGQQLQDLLTQL